MRNVVTAILLVLSLLSYSSAHRNAVKDDIAEKLIRDQISWYTESRTKETARANEVKGYHIYISLYGDTFNDPPASFMQRFADTSLPAIVSLSEFREDGYVIGKQTGWPGYIYQINKIILRHNDKAEAIVTLIDKINCKYGYHYYVRLNKGNWLIDKKTMTWKNCPEKPGYECR